MINDVANLDGSKRSAYRAVTLACLLAFLAIRVAGLLNDPLLEDHDSSGYVYRIGVFAELDPQGLESLTADLLPLYPMTAATLNVVGVSAETAARLVSLAASLLTAMIVIMLAVRLGSWQAGACAALLLAVEPTMARLSYAVLTEPLYTALVSVGLWLMVRYSTKTPAVPVAIALGVVFGLSFLDRVEAILFLAAIPCMQWCLTLASHRDKLRGQVRPLLVWTAAFVVMFAALAAPQVWFVSKEMNQFALNGRQAWSIILATRNGQTEEQRLRGLDYSPTITNLDYLQQTPQELAKLDARSSLKEYAGRVAKNLDVLQRQSLPQLLGWPILAFAPLGLLLLLRTGQGAAAFVIAGFAGLGFVAPVLYNAVPRHILVSAPPLILLAALGVLWAAREIAQLSGTAGWRRWSAPALLVGLGLTTIAFNGWALGKMMTSPDVGNPIAEPDSDPARYARFVPTLKAACTTDRREKLIARKRYIATLGGCTRIVLPYATLEQLRVYAAGNGATLMFVESKWDSDRPFYRDLTNAVEPPEGFEVLASNELPDGQRQTLYRLNLRLSGNGAAAPERDPNAP